MISVIIPVFNVENCLRKCLDSVKAQTFYDFEVILVDDGSDDSSGGICDEYASADQRFRVVHQSNQGVASARNRGLDLAGGDFIYFADGDDELRPEALEHLYAALKQGGYDVSASGFSLVKGDEAEDKCIVTGSAPLVYSSDELLSHLLIDGDFVFFTCWNKLISRQLVSDLRFRDINQEDFLFCGQLYLKLHSLIFLNEPLYIYYDRTSSLSKDFSYIGPHQVTIVLAHLLEDTPKERKEIRRVILARMYRRLLTSLYFINEWPLSISEKKTYRETCRAIFKRNHIKYLFCPGIPVTEKMRVVVARLFPKLFGKYMKSIADKH